MNEPFELIEDARGRLVLKRPGQDDVEDVRIRRAFPWSHRDRYISLRTSDGKEILMISNLAEVPAGVRAVIDRSLSNTVFIPKITRIDEVDIRFGYQQWKVQTDRGPIEFRVQEREDIRFLNDGRFSLKDADGNIYEMPSLNELDEHSQKAVESLV